MIYLYDGSFEGLLTCVFEAYTAKEQEISILPAERYRPSFLDTTKTIDTDMTKFQRVYASIQRKISKRAQKMVYKVWLSEDEQASNLIFHFLKMGYKMGASVTDFIQDPAVRKLVDLNRKVGAEVHRFLGLLRFQEIVKGIFYAGFEPDHNITVLVAPHFTRRLARQPFLIHDKRRNITAVYDGQALVLTDEVPLISGKTVDEDEYAKLWRAFFKTVAIQERKNTRTQKQFMPQRYWKNLIEMQPPEE